MPAPGKSSCLGVALRRGLGGQGGGHLRKEPEATGPRAGAERLAEARHVLAFEDKAGMAGKAEDKEGEGEAVVQRQEPEPALP